MPYIKSGFNSKRILPKTLCWKCGQEIANGTLNWSYNTQSPGKYCHRSCNVKLPRVAPILEQYPKPYIPPKPKLKPWIAPRLILVNPGHLAPVTSNAAISWCETVQKMRADFAELNKSGQGVPIFVSPRFAYASAQWFLDGLTWEQVLDMELFKGQTDDLVKIGQNITNRYRQNKPNANGAKLPVDITDDIQADGKHKATPLIKTVLRRRKYPFLHGSPGAGKTHLIMTLADDMELPFVLISCAPDMFKSEVTGSRSPLSGEYFRSDFRNAWENGGVILFDECGLAPGAFLNILNAALAQKLICFPDLEKITMHENCFIVFADNSTLYGNDPLFPERQDCGQAFRDRISYIKFEYDERLECAVLQSIFGESK